MYHKIRNTIFSPVKYHAIDYSYEVWYQSSWNFKNIIGIEIEEKAHN